LWRTDGTSVTQVVDAGGAPAPDGFNLTDVNGTLYYVKRVSTKGYDLWRTDGTAAGTFRVLQGDASGSSSIGLTIRQLASFNGRLMFQAWDHLHGFELWTSDGTATGTVLLMDLRTGLADGVAYPLPMTPAGATFYFFGVDDSSQFQALFRTNGTAAGTVRLRTVSVTPTQLGTLFFKGIGETLFFADGYDLWRSDGTVAGTIRVPTIGAGFGFPVDFGVRYGGAPAVALGDSLLWSTELANSSRQLRSVSAVLPAAPDSLATSLPGGGGVQLNWADRSSNESGFVIERSHQADFAIIDKLFLANANAIAYLDSTGTADLYYRVRAVNAAGSSAPTNVVQPGDTTPPVVAESRFDYQTSQTITLRFSEDVLGLSGATFTVATVPGGTTYPASLAGYDAATKSATYSISGPRLPDGNYRATLAPTGIHDGAGNAMPEPQTVDFFVFAGDADHDRTVGAADFNLLASSFGKTGQSWATGDFDYDGAVGPADFNLLASRFGTTLAPPPPPAGVIVTAAGSIATVPAPSLAPVPAAPSPAKRTTPKRTTPGAAVLTPAPAPRRAGRLRVR
jgi:ELWxxDGT repeat protein